MTPRLCRAARAMLGWSQAKLAVEAGYGTGTVSDYEVGRGFTSVHAINCLAEALRRHGVTVSLEGDVQSLTYRQPAISARRAVVQTEGSPGGRK